ncbi:hypothetical protein [Campylobacter showae]|uniref:hypothetical protein n=1 Tax=Campylobacter showae TaxID=204 RepID=UPI0026EF9928|nr:hypothetical protein [Campylobacter showae]
MIKFDVNCRLSELHTKFKSGLEVPTASVKSLKLELSSGDEISLLAIVKAVNLIKGELKTDAKFHFVNQISPLKKRQNIGKFYAPGLAQEHL